MASYDPVTQQLTALYHPRTQEWEAHFELHGARLVGKTAVGRVTLRLLDMNHPTQVEARQLLIDAGAW